MLETFKQSNKVKISYKVNSIIYSIKRIPYLGKLISDDWYNESAIKILGLIIYISRELLRLFVFKLTYLFIIYMYARLLCPNISLSFITIFTILTLIGGIFNNELLKFSNDTYYAITLMKLDSKKYFISNYLYFLLKVFIGFLPFTILFGLLSKVPFYICLLMPLYVISIKIIFQYFNIIHIKNTKEHKQLQNKVLSYLFALLLIIIALSLPNIGITINELVFIIIFIISLLLSIFLFKKTLSIKDYNRIYKYIMRNINELKDMSNENIIRENTNKIIEFNPNISSNKKGYAYFHDLFVKRHSKILIKTIKTESFLLLLASIIIISIIIIFPDSHEFLNKLPLNSLPYFVFLMYLLNRGTAYTQALFMNCDHSMLTYGFYRRKETILALFKHRLKTLIGLNLIPALIVSILLPLILFLTGGTNNNLNYLIIFITVIFSSVFFSIHYLILYYLLQPYNINTEMKSMTYKIVQIITVYACYILSDVQLPTFSFGLCTILFTIIYSIVALILINKYAPKTFKIRN